MEQNGTLVRQVWQRVTAPIAQDASVGIELLLREVLSQVGLYRQLSGRLSGPAGELCRKLLSSYQASEASLRGMRILSGGNPPSRPSTALPRMTDTQLLAISFHRSQQLLTEFTARSVAPDFGTVFRCLANGEGENGVLILRLLGTIPYR